VDRIEGGFAVCECLQTGVVITVDKGVLPDGVKEGDVLRKDGDGLVFDEVRTNRRRAELAERVRRLFGGDG